MFKLIKLEMMKFNILGESLIALFMTIAVTALTYLIALDSNIPLNSMGLYVFSEFFITNIFFVFGAILLSKYFIGEYEKKTITILFSYPVNRKSLMIAKGIFVTCYIVVITILSYMINLLLFKVIGTLFNVSMTFITVEYVINSSFELLKEIIKLYIMHSFTLYIGFKYKSSMLIVVSSILFLMIAIPIQRLDTSIWFSYMPIGLGLIGFAGLLSILMKIDKVDLTYGG